MHHLEYLLSYGLRGEFGRFRAGRPVACQRGDRAVVRSHRGVEVAEVLREAVPSHAVFLPNTSVGQFLRLMTTEDERTEAGLLQRGAAVLERGNRLTVEIGLPVEILDVEMLLDGEHAVVHHLRWEECDVRPLVSTLSREFAVHVVLTDLTRGTPPRRRRTRTITAAAVRAAGAGIAAPVTAAVVGRVGPPPRPRFRAISPASATRSTNGARRCYERIFAFRTAHPLRAPPRGGPLFVDIPDAAPSARRPVSDLSGRIGIAKCSRFGNGDRPRRVAKGVRWALGKPLIGGAPYVPAVVISAGFSGGLGPGLNGCDLVLATDVVDADGQLWPTTWPVERPVTVRPGITRGRVLTMPVLISDPAQKERLGKDHNAIAVDMESATAIRVCHERGIPYGCLRAISDDWQTPLSPALANVAPDGRVAWGRLALALLRSPRLAAELWRLARQTKAAARKLGRGLAELLTSN